MIKKFSIACAVASIIVACGDTESGTEATDVIPENNSSSSVENFESSSSEDSFEKPVSSSQSILSSSDFPSSSSSEFWSSSEFLSSSVQYSSSEQISSSSDDQSESSSSADEQSISSSSVEQQISSSTEQPTSSSVDEQNFSSSSVESSSSSEEQSSSSIAPKICGPEPASLNLEEVFENQKKALFPDTCEYVMNIHVNSGGLISMDLRTSVLTAGPTKSVMTTRSSLTNTQTVRNDGRVKVTDMRTGNRLPSSDAETNLADFTPLIGTAADYSGAVLEDSLWKLIPIDEKTPTLYYSTCEERVMKIFYVSGDSSTTNTYTYTDEFAGMSGVLKTMHLDRSVYLRDASSRELFKSDSIKVLIDLEVLVAKKRSVLPSALFDVTR